MWWIFQPELARGAVLLGLFMCRGVGKHLLTLTLSFPSMSPSLDSSVSLFAHLQLNSSNKAPYADTKRHSWWQKPLQGCCICISAFPLHAACSGTMRAVLLFCITCTPAGSNVKVFCVNAKSFSSKKPSVVLIAAVIRVWQSQKSSAGSQLVCNAVAPVLPPLNLFASLILQDED